MARPVLDHLRVPSTDLEDTQPWARAIAPLTTGREGPCGARAHLDREFMSLLRSRPRTFDAANEVLLNESRASMGLETTRFIEVLLLIEERFDAMAPADPILADTPMMRSSLWGAMSAPFDRS